MLDNYKVLLVLFWIYVLVDVTWGQYTIPNLEFSALSPKGFRVQLPDENGVELFAFHGRLNDRLDASKEGDIVGDVISASNGKWTFEDPDLSLKVGDKIYYWIYVQYKRAGYTKRDLVWEVTELAGDSCSPATTTATAAGRNICAGSIIFEDEFKGAEINRNNWIVQKYIPSITDDDHYEFVSYQDRDENRFIRSSILHLKPVAATTRNEVYGTLDLSQGCTRTNQNSCFQRQVGGYILPPVVSAKIISKMSFKYGRVEIKAKLPLGDWIFPQIELIPKNKLPAYPKILIAFARGNRNLLLNNNEDIGSTLLFGGPTSAAQEPQNSAKLRSRKLPSPAGVDMRTYTVKWTPSSIDLMVDNDLYGSVLPHEYTELTGEYQIALGVGVGGNFDFPDGVRSGNVQKPWTNFSPKTMSDFFNKKDSWISTWDGDNVDLQVDSVKVWAV